MFVYRCQLCGYGWYDPRPPLPRQMPFYHPTGMMELVTVYCYPSCVKCYQPQGVVYLGQANIAPQYVPPPSFPNTGAKPLTLNAPPKETQTKAPVLSTPKPVVNTATNSSGTTLAIVSKPNPKVPDAPVRNPDDPFDVFPLEILRAIASTLDRRALKFLSLVCKKWSQFGIAFLREFVPELTAYGSATSQLQPVIVKQLRSAKTVQLAVDKFPCPRDTRGSILGEMMRHGLKVKLLLGTKDEGTLRLLNKAANKVIAVEDVHHEFHKMHNKIWVIDNDGVITGSPNVSFAGMHQNVESMILIKNREVAGLFKQYLKLLRSNTPTSGPEFQSLKSALTKYNREDHGVKLAMAPLVNITDFVIEELAGATKIVVRQFLVSPKEPGSDGPDILRVLCQMAGGGTDIEVHIDEPMYNSMDFVKLAVNALVLSGCKVYLQKLVKVVNTSAENCVHDKLILAEIHGGVQKTLIGSAGFTTDVIANRNAENFICTDAKSVYQSFMKHHLAVRKLDDVSVKQVQVDDLVRVPKYIQNRFWDAKWLRDFM